MPLFCVETHKHVLGHHFELGRQLALRQQPLLGSGMQNPRLGQKVFLTIPKKVLQRIRKCGGLKVWVEQFAIEYLVYLYRRRGPAVSGLRGLPSECGRLGD